MALINTAKNRAVAPATKTKRRRDKDKQTDREGHLRVSALFQESTESQRKINGESMACGRLPGGVVGRDGL